MVIKKMSKAGIAGVFLRWASGLRFPYLALLTLILFVANLFIPDVMPFADEIIMGLVAALFASIRKKPDKEQITEANDSIES